MSPPAPAPPPPSESITTTSPSLPPRKDIFADCSSNDEDDGDFQEWHQVTTPSLSSTSTQLNNISLKEDSIMSLLLKSSSSSFSSFSSTKVKKERENQKSKERQTQKKDNIRRLKQRSEELQIEAEVKLEQLKSDFLTLCSAETEDKSNQEHENDGDHKKNCPSYYASVPSGAEEPLSRKDVDWISMNAWITDNNAKISPKNQDSSEASDRLFSLFKRMANEQKKRNKLNDGALFK